MYHPVLFDAINFKEPMIVGDHFVPVSYPGILDNSYLVSDYGRIYSIRTDKILDSKPSKSTGYKYLNIANGSPIPYHRIVGMTFVNGYSESTDCINHIDGVKTHNWPSNLEWVSRKDNNLHAIRTGLNKVIGACGENAPSTQLTERQVHYTCELLEIGFPIKNILSELGLEDTLNNYEKIRAIKKGYAWKSVSSNYNIIQTDLRRHISNEEIHTICSYLEQGYTPSKICSIMYGEGISRTSSKEIRHKYNTIIGIKNRINFKEISSKYNF